MSTSQDHLGYAYRVPTSNIRFREHVLRLTNSGNVPAAANIAMNSLAMRNCSHVASGAQNQLGYKHSGKGLCIVNGSEYTTTGHGTPVNSSQWRGKKTSNPSNYCDGGIGAGYIYSGAGYGSYMFGGIKQINNRYTYPMTSVNAGYTEGNICFKYTESGVSTFTQNQWYRDSYSAGVYSGYGYGTYDETYSLNWSKKSGATGSAYTHWVNHGKESQWIISYNNRDPY